MQIMDEIEKELEELREKIRYHNHRYYALDDPVIQWRWRLRGSWLGGPLLGLIYQEQPGAVARQSGQDNSNQYVSNAKPRARRDIHIDFREE